MRSVRFSDRRGGVPAEGVVPAGGSVPAPGGGVYPSMHWGRHPPVNRITDRCKKLPCCNFFADGKNSPLTAVRNVAPQIWGSTFPCNSTYKGIQVEVLHLMSGLFFLEGGG